MAYFITKSEISIYPSVEQVDTYLNQFGMSHMTIKNFIDNFVCPDEIVDSYGYQQSIAAELANKLKSEFAFENGLTPTSNLYSPNLNEQADVVLKKEPHQSKIYFELEFRPNFEKDLVKFQIGSNNKNLGLGVLIVALNRNSINSSYSTMPEFSKVKRVIDQLKPIYPLLLIGIEGEHLYS
jgi:hypothetical protein